MKHRLFPILLLSILSINLASSQETTDTLVLDLNNDTVEYQLIIIDFGFDSWLATQKSRDFYSNEYYRSWNNRYVTEWNYLYNLGKYHDNIESYIDYRPDIDYGIDINYKLYQYFQFFENKYKISLVRRR